MIADRFVEDDGPPLGQGPGYPAPQVGFGLVLYVFPGAPLVWAIFPWPKDVLDLVLDTVDEVACPSPPGAVGREPHGEEARLWA